MNRQSMKSAMVAASSAGGRRADVEVDQCDFTPSSRGDRRDRLIRATHNRKVQHELGYLIPTIEQAPRLDQQTLARHRHPTRPARPAHLPIRAMPVTLEVP